MKHFTVTVNVVNCGNCPYHHHSAYGDVFCTEADGGYHDSVKVIRQNSSTITESCPFFNQLKED